MAHSQFDLLRQRRFLPYFLVQALGAFNDNVFRQAIIGLLGAMVLAGGKWGRSGFFGDAYRLRDERHRKTPL